MSTRTSAAVVPPPAAPSSTPHTSLLTAREVMARLSVSRTGLHYLMRRHGLPYIKLGKGRTAALRFSPASLDLWIAQRERNSPTL